MYAVSLIIRYMRNPTQIHLQASKRILRYLQGIVNMGIMYKKGGNVDLLGYTNTGYAGDLEVRKNSYEYVFILSNGAVVWYSKKQPIVTLSSTEVVFVDVEATTCQAVWMRNIIKEMGQPQENSIPILGDNSSTIKLQRILFSIEEVSTLILYIITS